MNSKKGELRELTTFFLGHPKFQLIAKLSRSSCSCNYDSNDLNWAKILDFRVGFVEKYLRHEDGWENIE